VVGTGEGVTATTADGNDAVRFDPAAVSEATAPDESVTFTFFVEAPASAGAYDLGPVEVSSTATDDGYVPVSGTTSTEYVLGTSPGL
jgi:hypothetical protein